MTTTPRRRWKLIITASLLLGAAVNVGVAWWPHILYGLNGPRWLDPTALWSKQITPSINIQLPGAGGPPPDPTGRMVFGLNTPLASSQRSGSQFNAGPNKWRTDWTHDPASAPDWYRDALDAGGWCGQWEVSVNRAGFPFRSLSHYHASAMLARYGRVHMMKAEPRLFLLGERDAVRFVPGLAVLRPSHPLNDLPTEIIWPGFLANSLIYASFFCAGFLALGSRRRRRLRNGLCLRCGYDISATPDKCPECGMEVHT